jgi:hypothetical protein
LPKIPNAVRELPDEKWFEENPSPVVFDWHPMNKTLKKKKKKKQRLPS